MDYGLIRAVLASTAFVPIDESEYLSIKEARDGLFQCLFIEENFDIVVENFLELETTLLESVARHMILRDQDYRWFQVERGLFNRRLINLLTAGLTYENHVKQHFHNVFRHEGASAPDINALFSQEYDGRLGYRAVKALRNFVQHRGFPVHAVTYHSERIEHPAGNKLRFAVSPFLHPNELREDGGFKKAVLKELEVFGEKVDLKVLLRDYVEGLAAVHDDISQYIGPKAKVWDAMLSEATERFQVQHPEEDSVIGLAAVVRDTDGCSIEQVQIFSDFISYRKHLAKKNSSLKNVARRYSTSEVVSA